jgi:hypothetical protein
VVQGNISGVCRKLEGLIQRNLDLHVGVLLLNGMIEPRSARGAAGWLESALRRADRIEEFPTSSFNRLLSLESDFAADNTCDDAVPVWLAPC